MNSIDLLLLGASILLIVSVVTNKLSFRSGVPSLLFFILIGMLAGSDGPGGIYFDDSKLAQSLGVVALVFILFSGGLDTDWAAVRPVFRHGLTLATVGVVLTAAFVGAFAVGFLGFSWLEGLLLGAVVSSTDAAAVFAVLRSKNISLKPPLKPLLELESGSNDPMAVFLTVGLIGLLTDPSTSGIELAGRFVWQMAFGSAMGYLLGRAMIASLNRLRLEYEGLYPVFMLSFVLFIYSATASLGGNGFLAVYLAGLVVGNGDFIHKRSLVRFHDGLAWLMQIAMFLTLGLLVFPTRLVPVMGAGLLVSIFLIFVARPASVLISLSLSRMRFREKLLVSWVGLRGAVPIILATFPLVAGVPQADTIFNLVFFIVLTSVLLQGTTIPLVARSLGVDAPGPVKPKYRLELVAAAPIQSELEEIEVPADSAVVGKQVLELGLPAGTLIALIHRGDEFIVASGGTVLEAGDTLLILSGKESLPRIRAIFHERAVPGNA